ncbi:ABC transporter ATP-binding protein [Streptomyces boncukensis]|uniref:Fatty acid ABC transporter ATP-binding/permease protein n=1 Tax=Streptomyces boncukensis TaxID=2711219 RepID=A0A6G4WUV4_9ACTN|nr:ABC transporter ATP-binding protein [Streptomyces boncukensis]NGO68324.1 ABC transporter ATP-binding protein [Streptomyces boncukensis]
MLRAMGGDRRLLVAAVGVNAASVGLATVVPYILGRVTDRVVQGLGGDAEVDFPAIGRILLGIAVLVVLSALAALARGRLAVRLAQRTAFRFREQAEAKLHRLPLGYFDRSPRGEVLSRVTNDIDNLALTLQQTLTGVIANVLTLLGALVMMLWISPLLTLVALVTIPVALWVTKALARRAQPQFVRSWEATGKLNAHLEETFTGHEVVTVHGRQREAALEFAARNEAVYRSSSRAQVLSGVIEPVMNLIGNLNYVLVAVVGGLRVTAGAMTVGDIQAFVTYTVQFNRPVTQMGALANIIQSGLASAERVFALLDADEQRPDAGSPQSGQSGRAGAGRVEFQRVSFRYEPDKPLIEEVSLTAEPGHTVAIVGPTGAGKTTLVNLLMRFYEVSGGRIAVDGVDIAALPRPELRGKVGMVLQDTWLFGGTIAENIAYGAEGAEGEQVVRAAAAAHADPFVRTLPRGYETVVDGEGAGLSAGEKQLITIARAFLTDPPILVLDEATSSVDTRTEVLIQRAMTALRSGRTCFVIAHRLSTIRDADTIVVMEDGRIAEQGTHHDLLAAEGAYARLHAAQFTRTAPATD